MFKKKSPPPEGRRRPVAGPQQTSGRTVFSYHASRSARPDTVGRQEQPQVTAASNQRRNTRRKWFRRAPVMVGLVIAGVFVALNLPVSNSAKIVAAEDAAGGIFLQPPEVYAEAAERLLKDSVWQSFKPTLNAAGLEEAMEQEFPELANVTVTVPLVGSKPTLYLVPAEPALLLTPNPSEILVVDVNGRALIDAAKVKGIEKLKLPVVRDDSLLPLELGETVLPSSQVAFITEVNGQLKAKGLVVEGMALPPASSQLEVKVKDEPYIVKFNLQGNAREEAGSYLAVKRHLEREGRTPTAYIDVRVVDRAYYR